MSIPTSVIGWLRANAVPLETSEPEGNLDDLEPLRAMIGDARIVALGEATHGTHEFFAMKHRMLRFLVEEMGFDTFAMEANWPEADLINDFVNGVPGDPAQLLRRLGFWTWNTQEVLDLIGWMRRHNEGPGKESRVCFRGFDIQWPHLAINHVLEYLARVDPLARDEAEGAYNALLSYLPREKPDPSAPTDEYQAARAMLMDGLEQYSRQPKRVVATCRKGLRTVYEDLSSSQSEYESRSSPTEFAQALQAAKLVLKAEETLSALPLMSKPSFIAKQLILRLTGRPLTFSQRDAAMAEMAVWLLEKAGLEAKMVIWGHNGHIMAHPGSMGAHLRQVFGRRLVVAAFDFSVGEFMACKLIRVGGGAEIGPPVVQEVGPPPKNSCETAFRAVGLPRFVVDLRELPAHSEAGTWFERAHPLRYIGAVYSSTAKFAGFRRSRLRRETDLLFYFEQSTPSLPLNSS